MKFPLIFIPTRIQDYNIASAQDNCAGVIELDHAKLHLHAKYVA